MDTPGFRQLELEMPPDFSQDELQAAACRRLGIRQASVTINRQSLDARNRSRLHWELSVGVSSPELTGGAPEPEPGLRIPQIPGSPRAVVVGSGPAGMFAALVLQAAGCRVTVLERGCEIGERARQLAAFEAGGLFPAAANYAFGEGGAGSFSDGKLTSRSKHIGVERQFVLDTYAAAGAPAEIRWLAHPHLGTDNLRRIVARLRADLLARGGEMRFNCQATGLETANGTVRAVRCGNEGLAADLVFFATGHSAHDTCRMLLAAGVAFDAKPFAIGCRAEHPQELINRAQWGCVRVAGLKAAEYRLTAGGQEGRGAYTFCMCPGGTVVPAAAFAGRNVVNGMSFYLRNGAFANAAVVAPVNLAALLDRAEVPPELALEWVDALEQRFYQVAGGYRAPACRISDFCRRSVSASLPPGSFPLGAVPADLWSLLPPAVAGEIAAGLQIFARRLRGFETGVLLGLESKTSSPVRVRRERDGLAAGFSNLFVIGEGSGWAGGIVSSAADGVRAALSALSA